MSIRTGKKFRAPAPAERQLLEKLVQADFPGRSELADLLAGVVVRSIDENGSLELRCQTEGKAPVVKRIPVEAEAKDGDAVTIHMLLHVVEGRPVELEFFREDGAAVKTMPLAAAFEVIVLPPAPDTGWIHRRLQ